MNRRNLLALALSAPVLTACDPFTYRYYIRHRLSLKVAIGDRRYEASSVNETKYTMSGWDWPGVFPYYGLARAEAVIVDLDSKGFLFGLMEAPPIMPGFDVQNVARDVLMPLLPESHRPSVSIDDLKHMFERLEKLPGEFDVPRPYWPVLARFRDLNDRSTAQLVTPENIEQVYGAGAQILGVTIAVTTDPITERIFRVLPWLKQTHGSLTPAAVRVAQAPLSEWLTDRSFKQTGW